MSHTRLLVRRRLQEVLHDMNPSDPLVSSEDTYNEVIERKAYDIAGRVHLTPSTVISQSITAGTFAYTLTDVRIQTLSQVILNSNGRELLFMPWEEFNAEYHQDATGVTAASGVPVHYTFREVPGSPTHDSTIRFGPTPSVNDTAKLHYTDLMAKSATPFPPYTGLSDTAVIPFPDDLIMAVIYACAGEIASTVSPEKLQSHNLNPNAGSQFARQELGVIRSYNQRMRQQAQRDRVIRSVRTHAQLVRT